MITLNVDMKDGTVHTFNCVKDPTFLELVVIFHTRYGSVELLQADIKGIRKTGTI